MKYSVEIAFGFPVTQNFQKCAFWGPSWPKEGGAKKEGSGGCDLGELSVDYSPLTQSPVHICCNFTK